MIHLQVWLSFSKNTNPNGDSHERTENYPHFHLLSSPGDVNPEREVARRVIERLNREFSYHFRIEAVLWERKPLIATEHFQTMITPPSDTDIVVVVLWSRLGSFLPHERMGKWIRRFVP